jgi:hypothetical protein
MTGASWEGGSGHPLRLRAACVLLARLAPRGCPSIWSSHRRGTRLAGRPIFVARWQEIDDP